MDKLLAKLLAIVLALVIASTAWAQVSTIPMATRSAGTHAFTAVSVPSNIRGLTVALDVSEATDPLPAIEVRLEGSVDGGVTWIPAGGFKRLAGNRGIDAKNGQPVISIAAKFTGGTIWSASRSRQLRGSTTIGGTMRFSMTVTPL